METNKFEIGDIIKRREHAFEYQPTIYYRLQGRRQLKGQPREFIAFRIAEKTIPGTWIIRQDIAIRVLGNETAELFDSDKELLIYLKIYDVKKEN